MAAPKTNDIIFTSGSGANYDSRLYNYYVKHGFADIYKKTTSGKYSISAEGDKLKDELLTLYELKEINYGRWVTNDARFNYTASLLIALHELSKALGSGKNLGMNKLLTVSIGGFGSGQIAFYNPRLNLINLSRYRKGESFLYSGGMGALAHEYGHALDFNLGRYQEPKSGYYALTNYASIRTHFKNDAPKGSFRYLANEILLKMIWQDATQKKKTTYYTRLEKEHDSEYWFRHCELFARAFEQYIHYKLKKNNKQNRLLTDLKYNSDSYMTEAELKRIIPLFDQFSKKFAQAMKAK